jgi:hypothetical protein
MADAEEPVPKLPRGKGIKLSGPEILRIVITAGMLVAIIVLARPCGEAVSKFMTRFDNGSASQQMPKPDKVAPQQPVNGVMLRGDMTDEERQKAIERARAAAAGSGSN